MPVVAATGDTAAVAHDGAVAVVIETVTGTTPLAFVTSIMKVSTPGTVGVPATTPTAEALAQVGREDPLATCQLRIFEAEVALGVTSVSKS